MNSPARLLQISGKRKGLRLDRLFLTNYFVNMRRIGLRCKRSGVRLETGLDDLIIILTQHLQLRLPLTKLQRRIPCRRLQNKIIDLQVAPMLLLPQLPRRPLPTLLII